MRIFPCDSDAHECRRAADAYNLIGKDRWMALMRCLVIVRRT